MWPSAAERAGYVALWVADQGSTKRPAPPHPLLHKAPLMAGGIAAKGCHRAGAAGRERGVRGVLGQGKSNAARVVMAGAALDPLAELWVFVFAHGDFDACRPGWPATTAVSTKPRFFRARIVARAGCGSWPARSPTGRAQCEDDHPATGREVSRPAPVDRIKGHRGTAVGV